MEKTGQDDTWFIEIKVTPRSSKDEIVGSEGGVFKIRLTAPPVEGKANKALKQVLSKQLGVPRGKVEIVSGKRSRMKRVRVTGLSPEEGKRRLTVHNI